MELLTVDQFREHTETALGDDAIQRLIDAAVADINDHCGLMTWDDDYVVPDAVIYNDYGVWAYQRILRLDFTPGTILSVADVDTLGTETELVEGDGEDWVLDGQLLRRNGVWGPHTRVTYVPTDTFAQRQALCIKLVDLSINIQPGQGFAGAATWQETFKDYEQEKQHLLWSLCAPPVFA